MSDNRFDKLEEKIDQNSNKLSELTTEVRVGFSTYNVLLKEHMRRTELNEKLIYVIIVCLLAGGVEKLGLVEKLFKLLVS